MGTAILVAFVVNLACHILAEHIAHQRALRALSTLIGLRAPRSW